ncbi:Hypothetical predicted protein [Pelobates cultripes]|uniref:Uncharacterized protein n=1 Tax=Pelobates cultripes TaxID=61616 RepID=A0AAD1SZ35_PELCU|nr:Hypothetical predicted protein [Pelobates cultripes]
MAQIVSHGDTGSYRTKALNYSNRALNSQVDKSFAVFGIKLPNDCAVALRDRGRRGKVAALPSLSHKFDSKQTVRSDLGPKPIVPPKDPSGKSIITSASDFQRILSAARIRTDKGREKHKMAVQASRGEKDMLVLVAEAKKDKAEFERVRRVQKDMVEKQRSQIMERTSQVKKEVGHLRQEFQGNRLKCLNPTMKAMQREKNPCLVREYLHELKEKQLEQLKIIGSPIKYASVVTRKAGVPQMVINP